MITENPSKEDIANKCAEIKARLEKQRQTQAALQTTIHPAWAAMPVSPTVAAPSPPMPLSDELGSVPEPVVKWAKELGYELRHRLEGTVQAVAQDGAYAKLRYLKESLRCFIEWLDNKEKYIRRQRGDSEDHTYGPAPVFGGIAATWSLD